MRYEISIDGLEVIDNQTGLIWWKIPEPGVFTWYKAQAHAKSITQQTGLPWRVPTVNELSSLVDRSCIEPSSSFPDMPLLQFWSSSPYVGDTHLAWCVDFLNGNVGSYCRTISFAVRLVRSV